MRVFAIVLFLVTIFLLFLLHFLLFKEGLSYQRAFFFVFFAALFIAYIFVTLLIEPLSKQNERLKHLVRENLHEINLPIATIEVNTKLLLKGANEKEKKRIERIQQALLRLKRQYELLAYEIKKEYSEVKKERFNIKEVIKERVKFFEEYGHKRFKLDIEEKELFLDKIGLEQVLDNLIEIAI